LPGAVHDAHAPARDLAQELIIAKLTRRGVVDDPGALRQGRRIVRGWAGLGGRRNNRWFYFRHDNGKSFEFVRRSVIRREPSNIVADAGDRL